MTVHARGSYEYGCLSHARCDRVAVGLVYPPFHLRVCHALNVGPDSWSSGPTNDITITVLIHALKVCESLACPFCQA